MDECTTPTLTASAGTCVVSEGKCRIKQTIGPALMNGPQASLYFLPSIDCVAGSGCNADWSGNIFMRCATRQTTADASDPTVVRACACQ
jgi:hypothetical protein